MEHAEFRRRYREAKRHAIEIASTMIVESLPHLHMPFISFPMRQPSTDLAYDERVFDRDATYRRSGHTHPHEERRMIDYFWRDGFVPRWIDISVYCVNGTASQSFDILDWGSLTGVFESIQLPTLGGTLVWNTSQLYTTGVITVTGPATPPLAADFDENGVVNGADLGRWKSGFSAGSTHMQGNADGDGAVDGADYLIWQRQLGSPPSVAAGAAVPEPSALVVASMAGCSLALLHRRRRNVIHVALPALLWARMAA